MKYIVYQLDDDFNIINKFMFEDNKTAFLYIQQHLADEPNTNLLHLILDENSDIKTVKTYRKGNYIKTLL
jgi:hypothetical protein